MSQGVQLLDSLYLYKEWTVLDLVGLNRMNIDGTAQRIHAALADAQVFGFPGTSKISVKHGAY